MALSKNILLMKTLLRTGWIRAGVPRCEIESLADHSWSVSILTFILCIEENTLRKDKGLELLDLKKALTLALLHDFPESESLDLDKSIRPLVDSKELEYFLKKLETGAVRQIMNKSSSEVGRRIISIISDKKSPEYRLVRIADQIDLILQAKYYKNKNWLTNEESTSFQSNALKDISLYLEEFLFLSEYIQEMKSEA